MELQKAIITEFRLKKVTWRLPIKEKALAISRKCLILNVDQVGLEPTTSRLWDSKFHPIK